MLRLIDSARKFFSDLGIAGGRRHTGKIGTIAQLLEFAETQAAFVSQKTLFGYVQTRMGMEYSKAFQEAFFAKSLNIAKMHVFAACLSDLTIYIVAEAMAGMKFDDATRCVVARDCFRVAIDNNSNFAPTLHWAADAAKEFDTRLAGTNWEVGARDPENFTRSPQALVRWAPIAPELKRHDTEIVENSVKFTWLGVREEFRRRIDRESVAADVNSQSRKV